MSETPLNPVESELYRVIRDLQTLDYWVENAAYGFEPTQRENEAYFCARLSIHYTVLHLSDAILQARSSGRPLKNIDEETAQKIQLAKKVALLYVHGGREDVLNS